MPRLPGDLCYLYAFACMEFVKIGRAVCWRRRLHGIQTGCPYPVTKVFVVRVRAEAAHAAEQHAHELLRDAHHRGEWFRAVPVDRIKSALMRARGEAGRIVPMKRITGDDYQALAQERARLAAQEREATANLRAYTRRVAPDLHCEQIDNAD